MHQATDKYRGAKILNYKQLKHEFDVASLLFSGRETDSNWEIRQSFFEKAKDFLSSDDAKAHKKELVQKIHEVIPGVYNTIKSVRTTLIEEALSLVEAIGTYAGDYINMHTNEAILRFLMNESSVTKKATASRAFEATNNYLAKIKFRPKVLTFLCARAQDKNPQLREFAFGYIKTVLSVHGSAITSRLTENADLSQAVADSLKKGLVDAAPTVRSACKETYYIYEEHWPTAAFEFASKLDVATQRRLGVNITQSSSTASKPSKPLLRRTSKSTPSAIKKPLSSVSNNKAAKYDIKAAIKDSNAAFSIASKSHTYGFSLTNQRQTKAMPAQAPSPATMSRTESNTALDTTGKPSKTLLRRTSKFTPSTIKKPVSSVSINKAAKSIIKTASKPHTYRSSSTDQHQTMAMPTQAPSPATMSRSELDAGLNTTPSAESDAGLNTTPSAESDAALNTTPSAESDAALNTTPSAESDTTLNSTLSTESDTVVSSTTSKPSTPLLRRTSKSTPSTIKKPVSSVSINKVAKSNIKTALKPHTYGFSLTNQRQTMAMPAQAPYPATMFRTKSDTALSTETDFALNSTPSTKSDTVVSLTTGKPSKPLLRRTSNPTPSAIKKPASQKSIRPRLKKTISLENKYKHIKSRYKNIPK